MGEMRRGVGMVTVRIVGLYATFWRWGGWCRLGFGGPGLWVQRRKGYQPLFSVRNGHAKVRRVGPVLVRKLDPYTPPRPTAEAGR